MTNEELRKLILDEWKNGYIVYDTIDGYEKCKIEDFVKQPIEGQLYDINRDMATCLTLIGEKGWVNNTASTNLLTYYYKKCKELEKKLKEVGL